MRRIAFALLFLGLFVATACKKTSDSVSDKKTESSPERPELSGETSKKPARKSNEIEEVFWSNFRTSFMKSCTNGDIGDLKIAPDNKRAYCQCTLDKFEETYPSMDVALKVANNEDAILKLAEQCMSHLDLE